MGKMTYTEMECYCKWLTDRYNALESKKEAEISDRDKTINYLRGQVKTWEHNFKSLKGNFDETKKEAVREAIKSETYKKLQTQVNEKEARIRSLVTALSEMAVKATQKQ